jgi:2-keto-4-pentenoate hydratase/2-oxohepta-3-ene-1,7-dioic acid hydratase in catechol pathway
MAIPTVPTVFMKPAQAIADPFPAPTVIPKAFVKDNAADYESELAIVIGKDANNVSEEEAGEYLLG